MYLSAADRIWNRAALADGGAEPRNGDRALAAALKFHGLVMNGGVHHSCGVLTSDEVASAIAGFRYFGLATLAELLMRMQVEPALRQWTDETEHLANQAYWAVAPDDSALYSAFESKFVCSPLDFAPIGPSDAAV